MPVLIDPGSKARAPEHRPTKGRSRAPLRLWFLSLLALTLMMTLGATSVKAQAPPTPTGVADIPGNLQNTIYWSASTGATSYNLYRSTTAGGEGTTAYRTGITTLGTADTALTNGTTYFYKVAAVNASGTSAQSSEVSGTPNIAPAAPTGVTAKGVTSASVLVSWNAVTGATTYNVYRGTAAGGEGFAPFATGVTATSFTDTGVTAGTHYYYKVAAVGSNSSQSALSAEVVALPLVAPTTIVVKPGNTAITLRWGGSGGATGYSIFRGTTPGGEGTTAVGTSVGSAYTDSGLTNGTAYYYKIQANGTGGTVSDMSAEATGTPSASRPLAPATLTGVAGDTTATLTWSSVSGATSYNLYRGTGTGSEGTSALVTGVTSPYTNTGLTDGITYYYTVTAVNAGGESAWSPEASVKPLFTTMRINSGGSAYTDGASHTWIADAYVSGGSAITTASTIAGTTDQLLYQKQRAGTFTYTLPVGNGSYNVTLYFAEIQGFTAGQRKFNVTANSASILSNFDIFVAAGNAGNTAVSRTAIATVTAGSLQLAFTGVVGSPAVAAIQVVPINAGTPAADVPAPGWAIDMIPTDQCDADGSGPSSSEAVSLPSGAKENQPDSDLDVYNPVGPSVTYDRQYRSTLAAAGYSSPGLPQGWADNYDLTVTKSGTNYTLRYPNGGSEAWTTVGSTVTPPAGTPYLVSVATGSPVVTFSDHSTYTFAVDAVNPNLYRLSAIGNLAGQSVTINRDSANGYRLTSVTNTLGTALLTFAYPTTTQMTVTDTSVAGDPRKVIFNYGTLGGVSTLANVSKINDTSANYRWAYGYQLVSGHPYLSSVQSASPTGTGMSAAATTLYDVQGLVARLTDAEGNTRTYQYNGTSTQVSVADSAGVVSQTWTQKFSGTKNVNAGTTDSAGQSDSLVFAGANPYEPTGIYNKNPANQHITLAYDNYGNITTQTNRRGVITTLHQDPAFPLGQVDTVTVGAKTPTIIFYNPNGTVQYVKVPMPGTVGVSSWAQTSFTYTAAGNIASIIKPAPNSTAGATVTYTYSYTADPNYDLAGNPGSCSGVQERNGAPLVVTDPLNHSTHYRYDGHGNTTVIIDALGNRTDYSYNAADQLLQITYPATGQQGSQRANVVNQYQWVGGPLISTSVYNESLVLVRSTTFTPGAEGEAKAQSGSVQQANVTLDSRFRSTQITDGNGHAALKPQYDALGQVSSILYAVGPAVTFPGHDPDGNVTQRINSRGTTITTGRYADDNRPNTLTYTDGTPGVTYTYDQYDRVTQMVDGTGTTTYTYDDNDALLTTTSTYLKAAGGSYAPVTLTYTYYPDGSRASMKSPGTFATRPSFQYWYDNAGRMTNVLQPWVATSVAYTYDDADRMLTMNSSLVHTSYTYNQRDFMTSLVNKSTTSGTPTMSSFTNMTYDALGNRLGATISIPAVGTSPDLSGAVTYYYDDHDRMTDEIRTLSAGGGSTLYHETYTPDAADNLGSARGVSYGSNNGDQITNANYGYDFDGNQTSTPLSSGGSTTMQYDAEDRPTAIGSVLTQMFRGDGQRGWKANSSSVRTYFLYDGDTLVTELQDSAGSLVPLNTYSSGPGGIAQRFLHSTTTYRSYSYDPDGSVVHRQIQGEALYATSTFVYDHAGKLWINQPTGSSPGDSTLPYSEGYLSRWGSYTDYELRQAPAISLMPYMGGTYYDPATGRYVNRSADGVNPYAAFMTGNLDDFITGFGMTALDMASMSPGPLGKGADAISAYISYKQGDYFGFALSASSVVTNGAGSAVKVARRFGKVLNETLAVKTAVAKATNVARKFGRKPEPTTFITYVIKNQDKEVVYVGKTAGTGTPEEVLDERLRGKRHEHYYPEEGDKVEIIATQGNKLANAGAEDVWYNYYKLQGAKLRNKQNVGSLRKSRLARTRAKIEAYAKDLRTP